MTNKKKKIITMDILKLEQAWRYPEKTGDPSLTGINAVKAFMM